MDAMTLTPAAAIPTRYVGYRFRSRLEARWAVFLDQMGAEWLYEPEGYQLPSGPYLPDFLIHPHTDRAFWLEIKPDLPGTGPSAREVKLLCELATATQTRAFMYCRQPGAPVPLSDSWAVEYAERWHEDSRKGRVPGMDPAWWWDSGLRETGFCAYPGARSSDAADIWWTECPCCERLLLTLHGNVSGCPAIDHDRMTASGWGSYLNGSPASLRRVTTPRLIAAYAAARSARFEHGETPERPR